MCSRRAYALFVVVLAIVSPLLLSHVSDGKARLFYPAPRFELRGMPSLEGKVAVVTGGNTGIGLETARELARKGARVIIACRSEGRGLAAVEQIRGDTRGEVEFMSLDLASFASIRKFVGAVSARGGPVHILVNNAGIMACPFGLTAEGIEKQFGVNHVGHHLLTKLLLPILESSAPSRIVTVSSAAAFIPENVFGGVNLTDIYSDHEERYSPWEAYGRSKLANILFTVELNKKLIGKDVYANVGHPGAVVTELARDILPGEGESSLKAQIGRFAWSLFPIFALQPPEGALTSLYLASSPEVEELNIRGEYFHPIAIKTKMPELAANEELQGQLWKLTEELIANHP